VSSGECRPGTAESENLPDFFRIDLKAKAVSKDKGRLSAIKRIDRGDGEIILYGSEAQRFWVLMIREKTGSAITRLHGLSARGKNPAECQKSSAGPAMPRSGWPLRHPRKSKAIAVIEPQCYGR
jgi:hypothetical protein